MPTASTSRVRRRHHKRRLPRLKKVRITLLALGATLMGLGVILMAASNRTGNPKLKQMAILYIPIGVAFIAIRWTLAWLKRRRKLAVRKRRAERVAAESSRTAS